MKLSKRIKQIVSHTVEDYLSYGYIKNESKSKTIEWVNNALQTYEGLEDYTTIEISLQALKLLNSLDIVDLEYIHSVVLAEHKQPNEISITFKEVVL